MIKIYIKNYVENYFRHNDVSEMPFNENKNVYFLIWKLSDGIWG